MEVTLPTDVADGLSDAARQAVLSPNELAIRILRENLLAGPTTDEEFARQMAMVELQETRYAAESDLHGRSLEFSSEMLKLALACIAVVGFFVANIPLTYQERLFSDVFTQRLLMLALIGSAGCVGFALAYRSVAGGAAFHHVDFLKMLTLKSRNGLVEAKLLNTMKKRDGKFRSLQLYLLSSALLLFLAAVFLGWAFIRFMMGS